MTNDKVVRKILHLIPTLDYGGSARQLQLLATGLPVSRFQVRTCTLSRGGPVAGLLESSGIPVDTLGWHRLLDIRPFQRLRQLVRQWRPDVIHAWGSSSLRAICLTGRFAGRLVASAVTPPGAHGTLLPLVD